MNCAPSDCGEFLETIAPTPGYCVVLIQSFYDESYNSDLLCVAGYTFSKRNARLLDADWRKMLRRWRLPYFRMSACNAGKEPFDKLSEAECVAVATEAIDLIGQYATMGYAVTVEEDAFKKLILPMGFVKSAYELCAWLCLIAVKTEGFKRLPGVTGASFVFEAGFRDKGKADAMMSRIFKEPAARASYHYKGHAFVEKQEVSAIQAADLLAWQWYKNHMRRKNGATKPRGDLTALLNKVEHYTLHGGAAELPDMVAAVNLATGKAA